jgi:hypothetical protein
MSIAFMSEHSIQERQETSSQWVGMAGQLIDKFVGNDLLFRYANYQYPESTGSGRSPIGSAEWTINGKITITRDVR